VLLRQRSPEPCSFTDPVRSSLCSFTNPVSSSLCRGCGRENRSVCGGMGGGGVKTSTRTEEALVGYLRTPCAS